MIALGLSLVYRVTGIINLAQGGFCILGALLFYSLGQGLGCLKSLSHVAGNNHHRHGRMVFSCLHHRPPIGIS